MSLTESTKNTTTHPPDEEEMGRLIATATRLIDKERERWGNFRRALRKEQQEHFDEIFRIAKRNLPSIAFQTTPITMDKITLSVLVKLVGELHELKERLRNYGEEI